LGFVGEKGASGGRVASVWQQVRQGREVGVGVRVRMVRVGMVSMGMRVGVRSFVGSLGVKSSIQRDSNGGSVGIGSRVIETMVRGRVRIGRVRIGRVRIGRVRIRRVRIGRVRIGRVSIGSRVWLGLGIGVAIVGDASISNSSKAFLSGEGRAILLEWRGGRRNITQM
jgi:hypothetical protein